ncbi:MAG: hypothetical protein LBO04_02480 [Spirochaetaceae bacterium]|jgi:hypothetical protein|nr:hypothetical protein [Spirochaetaceae bacterium]
MRIKEKAWARGVFRLRVWKNGKLVEEDDGGNMIVDGARFQMAHFVAGDAGGRQIAAIALGTDGTPPVPGDLEITDPFIKDIDGVEYPASGQVSFRWVITTAEANDKAIREFGLLCADGTLFARYVRQKPLNKDSDFLLEGDWTIEF